MLASAYKGDGVGKEQQVQQQQQQQQQREGEGDRDEAEEPQQQQEEEDHHYWWWLQDTNFSTAYSEISRGINKNATSAPPDGSIHGLSIRTHEWRCTVWCPYNYTASSPMWEKFNASDLSMIELYDHRNETLTHNLWVGGGGGGNAYENYDFMENVNVVKDPSNQVVVNMLVEMIQAAWGDKVA